MGTNRTRKQRRHHRRVRALATLGVGSLAVAAGSLALTTPGLATVTATAHRSAALDASGIAAKVDPAVVDVNTTLPGGRAAGTGMVLTSSGEVLTNNHVINGATSVSVTDATGKTYTAQVVGYDAQDDVAVLRLQGASGLPTISASSTPAAVGDPVVAIGNAGGRGGTPSSAAGKVTAVNQTITATDDTGANPETLHGTIQVDADIQPGDSGGPLVNSSGEVIGMDSAGSTQQAGVASLRAAGGFGAGGSGSGSVGNDPFGGSPGWGGGLGPDLGSGSPLGGGSGAIPGVAPGSGTGTGTTTGFAIPIQDALSIAHQISAGQPTGNVHTGTRAILGVEVQGSSAQSGSASSGVQISGVQPGTPAESAGLTSGDAITSIDGHTVGSVSDVTSALAKHRAGDKVNVTWTDGSGQSQQATIGLVSGPPA